MSVDRAALLATLTELVSRGVLVLHADDRPLQDPAQVRQILELTLPRTLEALASMALLVA